jgi:AraC-like DNA-binding protein
VTLALLHSSPHLRPPLSAFVDILWSYEGEPEAPTTPSTPPKERRLPDGSVTLTINLRDDVIRIYDQQYPDQFQSYRGCIVAGAHSTFTVIDTTSQAAMLGIVFKPGGACPFVRLPLAELQNQVIPLETVWGPDSQRLREQLLAATTPGQRFALVEQTLLARLTADWVSSPAVSNALTEFQHLPHLPTVAAVAERIGLSQTRFIHVFRDAVGLTPKQFCRVLRFQRVLRRLQSGAPVRWAELALSCGYFDQAHLIHDFQACAGLTPGAYLALRGEHRNHVAHIE